MDATSRIRRAAEAAARTPPRRVRLHPLVLALGACLGLSHGAIAATGTPVSMQFDCHRCEVLGNAELTARRGGFKYAGLEFEFGANIRSYIDNKLVLESVVNITSEATDHRVTNLQDRLTQIVGTDPASSPGSDPQSSPGAQPTKAGTESLPVRIEGADINGPVKSQAAAANNPAQVDLTGLDGAQGVTLNDRKGVTSVLHQATRERITSFVVNSASGRDIRQDLDISVTVRKFVEFQKATRQAIMNSRLDAARQR